MGALIQHLHIKNFKSVRDLTLDCERINVFIGKPNAGKSNVLEAISLLGVNYIHPQQDGRFWGNNLRYKTIAHLFSNFNIRTPIEVDADGLAIAHLRAAHIPEYDFKFSTISPPLPDGSPNLGDINLRIPSVDLEILNNGQCKPQFSKGRVEIETSPVKKYDFHGLGETSANGLFLTPPFGDNFYSIVESTPKLREEIQEFLKPNGLEFLLDVEAQRMAVVQKTEDTLLSFPLHLVPDTFQRYIFHLAAIMSNTNSVLLFEEPESHSYAPYVYQLAQHILNDEGGNQYFITTHSPYFLLPLMQEGKDVAVFATWFEDYQTHARRLTEEEIREMLDYGVDIFLNLDHLTTA